MLNDNILFIVYINFKRKMVYSVHLKFITSKYNIIVMVQQWRSQKLVSVANGQLIETAKQKWEKGTYYTCPMLPEALQKKYAVVFELTNMVVQFHTALVKCGQQQCTSCVFTHRDKNLRSPVRAEEKVHKRITTCCREPLIWRYKIKPFTNFEFQTIALSTFFKLVSALCDFTRLPYRVR